MKTKFAILITFASLSATALAQFWSLPPSSTLDGVAVKPIGTNSGSAHWDNPSSLGAYAVTGDGYTDPVIPGGIDTHLGLVWQAGASSGAVASKNALNSKGGTIRVIILGETAGWLNDFGYTYSGTPAGPNSYTALQNIQSIGTGSNIHFGDYFDIPLTIGAANKFDFWYNSVGDFGLDTPAVPTGRGGIYTAFNPSNGDAGSISDQFLWARNSIKANTWIPSMAAYAPVDTYLVGVDDWKLSAGSDRDYSDFRFALQFFDAAGAPLGQVPEPSTTALWIGLLVLMISICGRRLPKLSFLNLASKV